MINYLKQRTQAKRAKNFCWLYLKVDICRIDLKKKNSEGDYRKTCLNVHVGRLMQPYTYIYQYLPILNYTILYN